jgi:alanyl-tRNA synthetase
VQLPIALWHQAESVGPARVVRAQLSGRTLEDLKHLAQRLAAHPQTVALLAAGGQSGEKTHFVFGRSDDLALHMGTLVRQACELTGGQGGGRPNFAQGGGPNGERTQEALDLAVQVLSGWLSKPEA